MSNARFLGAVLGTIATIAFVLAIIMSVVWWYDFSGDIEDYLKLAGDAPTVEKANEFLATAVSNIERHRLTSGNSAFFFHKPDADIGIWYGNIKGALETTDSLLQRHRDDPSMNPQLKQLERDNALMKIREVVLDGGSYVTTPTNISWFPYQWAILLWYLVSGILAVVGWAMFGLNPRYRY